MPDRIAHAGYNLLDAWLDLSSTLWNTRIVNSMTYNEAHIMGLLLRFGSEEHPLTATDLIRRTRLLKSQMNKILTSLEHQGFITRLRAKEDKRLIHIRLTPAGRTAYLEEHKGVEDILRQLVTKLGAERSIAIARELCDVTDALSDIITAPNTSI